MAGYSTAVVIVGPQGVGPFGVRAWRATNCLTLIEKHRQVWLPTPIGYAAGSSDELGAIYLPEWLPTAQALAIVTATTVIEDPGFLELVPGAALTNLEEAPQAQVNELLQLAVASIAGVVRLGVVALEPQTALTKEECWWLQSRGVDLEYFVSQERVAEPRDTLG